MRERPFGVFFCVEKKSISVGPQEGNAGNVSTAVAISNKIPRLRFTFEK